MNRSRMIIFMIWILLSMSVPARAQNSHDQLLAFAAGDTLYTIETTGENLRELGAGSNPVWSPDGSLLAFYRDSALWIMDADGSHQRMLVAESVSEGSFQWSPNSAYLAFRYPVGLFIVNVTGEARPYPISEQYVSWYAWSADSTHLAYVGVEGHPKSYPATIEIVAIESGTRTVISSDSDCSVSVNWSPDGTQLAILPMPNGGTSFELTIQALDSGVIGTLDISAVLEGETLVKQPEINWPISDLLIVHVYLYDTSALMKGTRQSVWFVNPSDGSTRQIATETDRTYVGFPYDSLALTPDGTGLYYLETECAEGYYSPVSYARVMRVNLGDLSRQIVGNIGKGAACGGFDGPAWSLSPDGAQIAFVTNNFLGDDAPGYGLHVMDRDGQNLRLLFETDLLAGFDWRPG